MRLARTLITRYRQIGTDFGSLCHYVQGNSDKGLKSRTRVAGNREYTEHASEHNAVSRRKKSTPNQAGTSPAHDLANSSHAEALVFSRDKNGLLVINSPASLRQLSSSQHGYENSESYEAMAGRILIWVLSGQKDPGLIVAIGSRFEVLARAFSSDFLDCQPSNGGIVPVEQINGWIARVVADNSPHEESGGEFHEQWDLYDLAHAVDLAALPFNRYGCICARTTDDRSSFNFRQCIWLCKGLEMDWMGESLERQTLAANIIDRFAAIPGQSTPLRHGINKNVDELYLPFAEELIAEMPASGGQIPVSVIHHWLLRHT